MTKYLISFPSEAMDLSEEKFVAGGEATHAVIAAACRCPQELSEFMYDPES